MGRKDHVKKIYRTALYCSLAGIEIAIRWVIYPVMLGVILLQIITVNPGVGLTQGQLSLCLILLVPMAGCLGGVIGAVVGAVVEFAWPARPPDLGSPD
jgi:hypothetical protein